MRILTVFPHGGGLGNNLATMASCMAFARDYGYKLKLLWQKGFYKDVPFEELFEPIDGIEVLRGDQNRKNYDLYIDMGEKRRLWGTGFFGPENLTRYGRIYIETCLPFYAKYTRKEYEAMVPIPSLMGRIRGTTLGFNEGTVIGVHVRLTDSDKCVRGAPIDLFFERMNKLILDGVFFFVASDTRWVEEAMKERYGPLAIVSPKRNYNKYNIKGVQDAVVDMWCLSRTKYILGSFYSSFSFVAASIGGINKICIGEEK